MQDHKPRNLIEIADKIIDVIKSHSDLKADRADEIINQINKVKRSYTYTAPEITYMCWEQLSKVLSIYFVPSNSKWETEIMIIFNDLSGSVDDYWDGDLNAKVNK